MALYESGIKVESRKNNTDMKINMKSESFNNKIKLLHQNINEGGGGGGFQRASQ